MQATLTQIQRNIKSVFRPLAAGQSVRITEHGKPLARLSPDYPVVTMTPDEFRALPLSDTELDAAINRAVNESRQ